MPNQRLSINPAQYEVLNVLSCLDKEEDVRDLKKMLVQFLNERLQNELDRLWDEGMITENKMREWETVHMRTPYK